MKQKLFLFCGIPASGKTTLLNKIKEDANLKKRSIYFINFDDLEKAYKEFSNEKNLVAWHAAQNQLKLLVHYLITGEKENHTFIEKFCRINEWKVKSFEILCIEDNFYYESMRRPFKRMARQHQLGYQEIYLTPQPLTTYLERNSKREHSIPQQVIKNIHSKFEYPTTPIYFLENQPFVDQFDHLPLQLFPKHTSIPEKHHPNEVHDFDLASRKQLKTLIQQLDNKDKTLIALWNQERRSLLHLLKTKEDTSSTALLDHFIRSCYQIQKQGLY
mmetsp:Transcript_7680/g.11399  ORF Transcript_7680/g.11399 Transcript_7680/m.11399 type:complete len:273 (-) Transcript_7680:3738-4556(-)